MNIKSSVTDFLKLEELKDNIINLIESKVELKKLEIYSEIEKKLGNIIYRLFIALFLFTIFIFLNILIANLISHFSGMFWLGYVCIIAVYGIAALWFHLRHDKVLRKIQHKIADFMMK